MYQGSSQQAIKAHCPGVFSFYFNATETLISLQGIVVMLKWSYHVINFSNIPSLLRWAVFLFCFPLVTVIPRSQMPSSFFVCLVQIMLSSWKYINLNGANCHSKWMPRHLAPLAPMPLYVPLFMWRSENKRCKEELSW